MDTCICQSPAILSSQTLPCTSKEQLKQDWWTSTAIPPMSQSELSASRYNEGKLRWSLLYTPAIEELIRVLENGAKKYGDYNWQKGFKDPNCCYDSMMRHIQAYPSGEIVDKESGCHHLAHVMANCMFSIYFDQKDPES